jgi:eukaryotic-like serine/threonine-protein kinase
MGVVYRARDVRSGQEVALKTVHLTHEGHLASFRREIAALAALAHPGVVAIVDQGVAAGLPWYAMELVEGPTLRAFRDRLAGVAPVSAGPEAAPERRWWTTTLSTLAPAGEREVTALGPEGPSASGLAEPLGERALRRLLRVLLRLSRTLTAIHAAGLVHGDLKPENVLIRHRDRPVLVDFGLTARFAAPDGREPLEERLPAGGSFAYMAPEQIRGELFDARADLYALGCLLFEAVTGRQAFSGTSPGEVLLAQMALDPPPLASIVAPVPDGLEELVAALLAKEPRYRLGQAGEVAARLAAVLGEPAFHQAPPPPHLYRPAMVGRGQAMRALQERLRALRGGRGGFVLISGEPGMGKTRLLAELARCASGQGMRVVMGTPPPRAESGAKTPLYALAPLVTAIADCCRRGGTEMTARLLGARAALLARWFPVLRDLPRQPAREPSAGESVPESGAQRLFECLWETLVALARHEGSLTLVLDDLHLADRLTTGFVRQLAHGDQLELHPVLVVATCASNRHSVVVGDGPGEDVAKIALEPLAHADVADMAADMLGLERLPPDLLERLERVARGNPFVVSEYLRMAASSGLLAHADGRASGAP